LGAGPHRFPKRNRLLTAGQFRAVMQDARKWKGPGFTLMVRKNGLDHPRIGFAVSRKCARNAVVRNRIKRVVRECFRTEGRCLGGVDIVFVGYHGLGERNNAELRRLVSLRFAELGACHAS